jgi:hypothetical protein
MHDRVLAVENPVIRVRPLDPDASFVAGCGSAWKKDPVSGVIGVEQGPLIPMV